MEISRTADVRSTGLPRELFLIRSRDIRPNHLLDFLYSVRRLLRFRLQNTDQIIGHRFPGILPLSLSAHGTYLLSRQGSPFAFCTT